MDDMHIFTLDENLSDEAIEKQILEQIQAGYTFDESNFQVDSSVVGRFIDASALTLIEQTIDHRNYSLIGILAKTKDVNDIKNAIIEFVVRNPDILKEKMPQLVELLNQLPEDAKVACLTGFKGIAENKYSNTYQLFEQQLPQNIMAGRIVQTDLLSLALLTASYEDVKLLIESLTESELTKLRDELITVSKKNWNALNLTGQYENRDHAKKIILLIEKMGDITPYILENSSESNNLLLSCLLHNEVTLFESIVAHTEKEQIKPLLESMFAKVATFNIVREDLNATLESFFEQFTDEELAKQLRQKGDSLFLATFNTDNHKCFTYLTKRLGWEQMQSLLMEGMYPPIEEMLGSKMISEYLRLSLSSDQMVQLLSVRAGEKESLLEACVRRGDIETFKRLTKGLSSSDLILLLKGGVDDGNLSLDTQLYLKDNGAIAHYICFTGDIAFMKYLNKRLTPDEMFDVFCSKENSSRTIPMLDAVELNKESFINSYVGLIPDEQKDKHQTLTDLLALRKRTAHTLGISDKPIKEKTDILDVVGETLKTDEISLGWLDELMEEHTESLSGEDLEKFNKLRETYQFTKAHLADAPDDFIGALHQRIQSGKPTMVPVTAAAIDPHSKQYMGHSTTWIVWGNQLIMSNRGAGPNKAGRLVIFNLKSGHPTPEELAQVALKMSVENSFAKPFDDMEQVNALIGNIVEPGIVAKFDVAPQHHATCSFVNKKTSVLGFYALQELRELGLIDNTDIDKGNVQEVIDKSTERYNDFATFVKGRDLEDLLQKRYIDFLKKYETLGTEKASEAELREFRVCRDIFINYLKQHAGVLSFKNKDNLSRHVKAMKYILPKISEDEIRRVAADLPDIQMKSSFLVLKEVNDFIFDLKKMPTNQRLSDEMIDKIEKSCYRQIHQSSSPGFFKKHKANTSILFDMLAQNFESNKNVILEYIKLNPEKAMNALLHSQGSEPLWKYKLHVSSVFFNKTLQQADPFELYNHLKNDPKIILEAIKVSDVDTLQACFTALSPDKVKKLFFEDSSTLIVLMYRCKDKDLFTPLIQAVASNDKDEMISLLNIKIDGESLFTGLAERGRANTLQVILSTVGEGEFKQLAAQNPESVPALRELAKFKDLFPKEQRTARRSASAQGDERKSIKDMTPEEREARKLARKQRQAERAKNKRP